MIADSFEAIRVHNLSGHFVMNICDLEFIDDSVSAENHPILRGGATASAVSDVYTTGSGVYADAEAVATGDYSAASVGTGAVLINKKPYEPVGYGLGYGVAYGLTRYDVFATDSSTSIGVV